MLCIKLNITLFSQYCSRLSQYQTSFRKFSREYPSNRFTQCFRILYYIFNLYVTIRVKHYKNNIKILHQAIYATCPFSSAYIIIDNVCGIFEKREGKLLEVFKCMKFSVKNNKTWILKDRKNLMEYSFFLFAYLKCKFQK